MIHLPKLIGSQISSKWEKARLARLSHASETLRITKLRRFLLNGYETLPRWPHTLLHIVAARVGGRNKPCTAAEFASVSPDLSSKGRRASWRDQDWLPAAQIDEEGRFLKCFGSLFVYVCIWFLHCLVFSGKHLQECRKIPAGSENSNKMRCCW